MNRIMRVVVGVVLLYLMFTVLGPVLVAGIVPAAAFVVAGDAMSRAFLWLGINSPTIAWLCLGLLFGGLMGGIIALRRSGRSVRGGLVFWLTVTTAVVLTVMGANAPATGQYSGSTISGAPPELGAGRIRFATQDLTVHLNPNVGSTSLGAVPRGARLAIDSTDATGQWYAITVRRGTRAIAGWVSGAYLTKTPGT
jgi:hypothetical protein